MISYVYMVCLYINYFKIEKGNFSNHMVFLLERLEVYQIKIISPSKYLNLTKQDWVEVKIEAEIEV